MLFLHPMGPLSSMGSPITFIILPNVSGPTGTMMGCPVSDTPYPLTRPSVESNAIVRTVLPPKCYATSNTNLDCVPCTSSAFKINGSFPSKCTSTTAPITYDILPVDLASVENSPIHHENVNLSSGRTNE